FIKEGSQVDVLFWEERPLSVDIAPKVVLEVIQTEKGVKGNSATNVFKPAKLENGLEIKVPLFIKVGDKIKVDTRESTYVERVND
ncbi:MAG: elongation factor P, partial [Candidatus Nitrosomaritimum yanchengensis]